MKSQQHPSLFIAFQTQFLWQRLLSEQNECFHWESTIAKSRSMVFLICYKMIWEYCIYFVHCSDSFVVSFIWAWFSMLSTSDLLIRGNKYLVALISKDLLKSLSFLVLLKKMQCMLLLLPIKRFALKWKGGTNVTHNYQVSTEWLFFVKCLNLIHFILL